MRTLDVAMAQWIESLNTRGNEAVGEAALHPEAVVERYGTGATHGERMEVLEGREAIRHWLESCPEGTRFQIEGPVAVEEEEERARTALPSELTGRARYRVRVGEAGARGTWRFTLAGDGRVRWLEHRPDPAPEAG